MWRREGRPACQPTLPPLPSHPAAAAPAPLPSGTVWFPARRSILQPLLLRPGVEHAAPGVLAALRLLLWASGSVPVLVASLLYPLPLCMMLPLQLGLVGGVWQRGHDICATPTAAHARLRGWAAAGAAAVHPVTWMLGVPHPAVPLPVDPCTALVHLSQVGTGSP